MKTVYLINTGIWCINKKEMLKVLAELFTEHPMEYELTVKKVEITEDRYKTLFGK